jgi:glycosyltransferase involved in cell wall biosynthesis
MKRALIFATSYFPLVGGAEVAMKELTDRLSDWQFDLVCARIKPGLSDTEQLGNVRIHRCGFGHPIDKYLLPMLGVWRAIKVVGKDQVVIWSLMASYNGFAALVYTWIRPKARLLLTLQEGDPLEHYAKRTGVLTFLHKQIFRRANAIQAISHFLAAWAERMGAVSKPCVIPNGVDIARFSSRLAPAERERLRTQLGFQESDVIIITTSRLTLKNAVDDLIKSLISLPSHYKLLIAGEGADRASLGALVEANGLHERVTFLGARSQQELPQLLQCADLFCRPSLSEGLGISFLEALASGLPIIATPVGGIPDFLHDGQTGVFCQPRDPASIAKAVLRIQEEPGLRQKLIKQGEELVKKDYAWEGITKRIERLLEGLEDTRV